MTALVCEPKFVYPHQSKVQEMKRLIERGSNLFVVGLEGSGRGTALSMLYTKLRPVQLSIEKGFITFGLFVDMQNLVGVSPLRLYRLLLRTFVEQRNLLPMHVRRGIFEAGERSAFIDDPFVLQSELRNVVRGIGKCNCRVALIMDRFDDTCGVDVAEVFESLNALRSGMESALSFVFGFSADIFSSRAPGRISHLQRKLNLEPVWLSGLEASETIECLRQRVQPRHLDQGVAEQLASLTGGFPILIDAVADWWFDTMDSAETIQDLTSAFAHPAVQSALFVLWDGLDFYEREVIYTLATQEARKRVDMTTRKCHVQQHLVKRGFIQERLTTFELFSPLLNQWVQKMRHTIRGNVWFNDLDDTYYQGKRPLETLSPRAEAALAFFLKNPYKKCEKDQLIAHVWETPFVTDDSVYQVIRELRRSLEPDSKRPCYLLNHRSLRGGRYQFFPEGQTSYRQRFSS